MTRPLPEDVARTARAYLAALVPSDEVSDAWHELVADATYWGESGRVEVVRLAHQVAVQHQPVAPQVAVLALREAGMDQPASVARVLDVDHDTAQGWIAEVAASLDDTSASSREPARDGPERATAPPRASHPPAGPARPAPAGSVDGPGVAIDDGVDAPGAPDDGTSPAAPPVDGDTDAVRIGFEDDAVPPGLDEFDAPADTSPRRGMVVAAVVVVVLVVLVVWMLGR